MSNTEEILRLIKSQKVQLDKVLKERNKNDATISGLKEEIRRRKLTKYDTKSSHKDQENENAGNEKTFVEEDVGCDVCTASNEISENPSRIRRHKKRLKENKEDETLTESILLSNIASSFGSLRREKAKFLDKVRRIPRMAGFFPLSKLNKRSLSMYVVAEIVNNDATTLKKFFLSFGYFLLTCAQCYLFLLITSESTNTKCVSMADCQPGTYCGLTYIKNPICVDCATVESFRNNLTQCLSLFELDEWEKMDYLEFDYGDFIVEKKTEATIHQCFSYRFCNKTDLDLETNFYGHCDFLVLNKSLMDGGTWLLIIFLAFLWTVPICKDIEEAHTEEWVMDYYVDESFSIPVEIMRLAIRVRVFLMPTEATTATVVLVVTKNMSAKVMALDFLSIIFILETDNIFGEFFLARNQTELSKNTLQGIKLKLLSHIKPVCFWTRLHGLCYFVLMFTLLVDVDKSVENCDDLAIYFENEIIYSFFFFVGMHFLYKIGFEDVKTTACTRFLFALLDISRNILGLFFHMIFIAILCYVFNGDVYLFEVTLPGYKWIFICFSLIYIKINLYKYRIKRREKAEC